MWFPNVIWGRMWFPNVVAGFSPRSFLEHHPQAHLSSPRIRPVRKSLGLITNPKTRRRSKHASCGGERFSVHERVRNMVEHIESFKIDVESHLLRQRKKLAHPRICTDNLINIQMRERPARNPSASTQSIQGRVKRSPGERRSDNAEGCRSGLR